MCRHFLRFKEMMCSSPVVPCICVDVGYQQGTLYRRGHSWVTLQGLSRFVILDATEVEPWILSLLCDLLQVLFVVLLLSVNLIA